MQFLEKKTPVIKSASYFFGSQLGKIKLIFLIYTFFRTSMQKIGDGLIFFFFSKGFGLADIRPIPCLQKQLLPAKDVLCENDSYFKIRFLSPTNSFRRWTMR